MSIINKNWEKGFFSLKIIQIKGAFVLLMLKRIVVILCIPVVAMLSSCSQEEKKMGWEGVWKRTVMVPRNIQGRCVEETLSLYNREWKLTAVVHATYACNQPFVEMIYAGTFTKVKIRRDTDDRDIRLQVQDIHLVAMSDIGKAGKVALSDTTVENLSDKYVPEKYRTFEHFLYLSRNGQTMESKLYPPVQQMAIPLYPAKKRPEPYRKVTDLVK